MAHAGHGAAKYYLVISMSKTLQIFVIIVLVGAVIIGAVLNMRRSASDNSSAVTAVEDGYIVSPLN